MKASVELLDWAFRKGIEQAEAHAYVNRMRDRLDKLEPANVKMGMAMDARPAHPPMDGEASVGVGAVGSKVKPKRFRPKKK